MLLRRNLAKFFSSSSTRTVRFWEGAKFGFTRGLSNHFELILGSSWFPLHKFGGNLWKFWSCPFGAAGVNFEHSSRFCQSEGKFPTSNINKLFSYGESVFPKILVVWVIYRIAIGFYCGSFLEFDYFLAFVLHDLWQNVIYTRYFLSKGQNYTFFLTSIPWIVFERKFCQV